MSRVPVWGDENFWRYMVMMIEIQLLYTQKWLNGKFCVYAIYFATKKFGGLQIRGSLHCNLFLNVRGIFSYNAGTCIIFCQGQNCARAQ